MTILNPTSSRAKVGPPRVGPKAWRGFGSNFRRRHGAHSVVQIISQTPYLDPIAPGPKNLRWPFLSAAGDDTCQSVVIDTTSYHQMASLAEHSLFTRSIS